MIKINGSYGEGGGQIIRTAVAMSAITGKPITISNIRESRKQSGLKAQHLTAINSAAELCGATVQENKMGSSTLVFEPGKIKNGKFKFDIGTAGSITLVLQTLVPIAAFSNSSCTFEIIGGTDVIWSPTIDYFEHVFSDYAKEMGLELIVKIKRRGFYPKGGGHVHITVLPWKKKPYNHTNPGKLKHIDVSSISSKDLEKADVCYRQTQGFEKFFEVRENHMEYVDSFGIGTSFTAHAHFQHAKLGACAIGEKGKRAEIVGAEAAKLLKKEIKSGATVDHRMADQLIPYIAFAGGKFKTSRISKHLKTNIWVVEKFLGKKFKIDSKNKIVSTC